MVYDSQRGRTVLYGGVTGGNLLGDTWEWNGTSWTQVASGSPLPRADHAMAYDALRGRTVLWGGWYSNNGINYFGDTWTWDGTTWSQVATTGPQARSAHAMAYDVQRGRVMMFGGQIGISLFSDTWEWNGAGWTSISFIGSSPQPRTNHAMAYDSLRGMTVMFGGSDPGGNRLGETWDYGQPAYGSATSFGTGCGVPVLTLSPWVRPSIGTNAEALLDNIPASPSLAFVALGWSRTMAGQRTLPYSLAVYGMPGCQLLQSAEVAAQPMLGYIHIGTAVYNVYIPNNVSLLGLHVYLQGWADAPWANPGNTIVSNGLEWIVGY
jgi:hypothetical protein